MLSNPNNPTGASMPRGDVLRALEALRSLDVVVIDESFIDFADEQVVPSVDRDVMRYTSCRPPARGGRPPDRVSESLLWIGRQSPGEVRRRTGDMPLWAAT